MNKAQRAQLEESWHANAHNRADDEDWDGLEPGCYCDNPPKECPECGEYVLPGDPFEDYSGFTWHPECFREMAAAKS